MCRMPSQMWNSKQIWWHTRTYPIMQESYWVDRKDKYRNSIHVWYNRRTESNIKTVLHSNEKARKAYGGARCGLYIQPTRGSIPGPQLQAAAAAGSGSSTYCTVAGINIYIYSSLSWWCRKVLWQIMAPKNNQWPFWGWVKRWQTKPVIFRE